MNKKVQLYGILDDVKTMKDRTYRLVFRTNELPSDEAGILLSLTHDEGWCLFSSNPLNETDIPEEKPEFRDEKSASQRLRNVLYVWWQQLGEKEDFETFRKQKMETFIDIVKSKLE